MQSLNTIPAVPLTKPATIRSFRYDPIIPQFAQSHYSISGTTRNSAGTALPACAVNLFETATELWRAGVTSDSLGAFSFPVNGDRAFFLNGYKTGSPDVAGTTLNTLMGIVASESMTSPFTYYATKFDGSTYLTHAGALGTIANSQLFLCSFWLKMDATSVDGSAYLVMGYDCGPGQNNSLRIFRDANNGIRIIAQNSAVTPVVDVDSDHNLITAANGWHHVMITFDLSTAGNRQIYIDGVAHLLNENVFLNGANDATHQVNYTAGLDNNWYMGIQSSPLLKLFGSLSEFYFQVPGMYFTDVTQFRSAAGPVSLFSNGSRPTGSIPFIYLPNSFATFGTNAGSGGDFSVTAGALTNDTSIPP